MNDKAKRLLVAMRNSIRRTQLDPYEAVEAILAFAAGIAVRNGTHTCEDFLDGAHELYHKAEYVIEPSAPVKEPSLGN